MMLAMVLAMLAGTTAQAAKAVPQAPAPTVPAQQAPADAAPRASAMSDIGYMTAQQLSVKCNSGAASEVSYCFAYIAAVTDAARAYEIWLNAREFCLPAGASQSEARRAFMTYLSAYPSDASGQAASVVINALKQTYPCG